MMVDFAISTFCFGQRYYDQTNRFISHLDKLEKKPNLFIVTDSPEVILKREYVFVKNISEYDKDYSNYATNYYDFDFSVKRFALMYAFENDYEKVILTDTDVIIDPLYYTNEKVSNGFIKNTIAGQVTYNFHEQQSTNSMLGDRFKNYESEFWVTFNKEMLNEMPEDCVQFFYIEKPYQKRFLKTWDDCITLKKEKKYFNIPAGNIDEICFSALYNGLKLKNNSNIQINLFTPQHEKWY